MQILVNKSGTTLRLTKTEKQQLGRAASLLVAISQHAQEGSPLQTEATNTHNGIEQVIEYLMEADQLTTPTGIGM